MRARNFLIEGIIEDFLPFAKKHLGIKELPNIKVVEEVPGADGVTFGRYDPDTNTVYVVAKGRHPKDALRTLAHELVHYKQDQDGQLHDESGATGSPEENEANAEAGVIMRNFNQANPEPEFVDVDAIHAEALREHLLSNPPLYEDREDFNELRNFLDTHKTPNPIVNNSYVYASIHATPIVQYINEASFNSGHKLIKLDKQFAYFDVNGNIQRFPESGQLTGDAMSQIYFFKSSNDLEHFNTLLKLKFPNYKFTAKRLD